MPLGGTSYDILLDRGLLTDLATIVERHCPALRYAVITDSAVAQHYGERVVRQFGDRCGLYAFPAGEWNKTRETWAELTDRLLADGFGRDAAIIALGGGVVGDVAGFVAATYLRGLPYVQVPTSLLAMIDSSIGGKTGLDTPLGKNLVGAFHQPAVVIADIDTLTTLPRPQLIAGLAEAIKHGAVGDLTYFEWLLAHRDAILERDPEALRQVTAGSMEIKARVVTADERERGHRAMLNFGHTVAHAIEATTGYAHLHGEAVALGMLAEAALGRRLGVTEPNVPDRVRHAVETFLLPVEPAADTDPESLWQAMTRDKKNRAGSVMFALLERMGEPARSDSGGWTIGASKNVVKEVLNSVW